MFYQSSKPSKVEYNDAAPPTPSPDGAASPDKGAASPDKGAASPEGAAEDAADGSVDDGMKRSLLKAPFRCLWLQL